MISAEVATNQHEWAVVTGASSGIGRAFALELARRGHPILLVARRRDELQRVAAEITAGGGRAEPLVADLASAGGVEAVARAAEALDDVGVLVNNAGAGSYGPFLEQPVGRDAAQVALNIDAVVALTRRILPRMVARGRGQIINVASVLAFMPTPYFATYAATKAFVLSFSEALAHELRGTGVRVLAVSPGIVKTEFSGVAGFPEQESALPKLTPEAVVRATLRAAKSGRVVRVVGSARLLAVLAAITPRPLMRRIMGRIFAPRRPAPSSEQHLLT
jgi:short-subunit dehydrogenase